VYIVRSAEISYAKMREQIIELITW